MKAAAEPMTHEKPSAFKWRVSIDKDVVRFDPTQCPWNALRDVMYAKHNTNMNRVDIRKALKALYPDEEQIQNMSSGDVDKMVQWWKDPTYPYRHRPLFCGPQSYEKIGLRLRHALSPPKTPKPLAAAPVEPMRTVSPPKKLAGIPLPPRDHPRDSIFTTEGSTKPEKPETRQSDGPEAAKQRAGKVKTKDDLRNEVTRQQALTLSTNTNSFKVPSNRRSTNQRLQNSKAATYCGEHSANTANYYGNSTHSHVEDQLTSDLESPPYLQGRSNGLTLQSKAQSQEKPMKQSLMLAPPPQLIETYSVKYPELSAKSKPNTRPESGTPPPTYWNCSAPPHSSSRSPSSSRPAKRQALGEKPANVWHHNGLECQQLPSINYLFPSEHWENLRLKTLTTGPCRIAGQDKNQIIVTDQRAYPPSIYGQQDRPVILPPLELNTPSIPSLSSSSAVTPTSPTARGLRMTYPFTPSPVSVPPPDLVVRKSYSEGRLKLPLVIHSGSGVRKRNSEGSLKFTPAACPWHAIRDVALARDRMDLTEEQIALLLSHRYGQAYPSLKQIAMEQVQELWEYSRTCRDALYTERDCEVVEQQLWNDLRTLGLV